MRESRFISGPEGAEDKQYHLVNKLEDIMNSCGRQFNPEQPEYWEKLKEEIDEWAVDDLRYLVDQYHLFNNGEKIKDIAQPIWRRKNEERAKKYKEFKRNQNIKATANKIKEKYGEKHGKIN